MAFVAQYKGTCAECSERVEPGQMIRFNDDRKVEHVDCDASAPDAERPVLTCPTCNLTRPCEHDDY